MGSDDNPWLALGPAVILAGSVVYAVRSFKPPADRIAGAADRIAGSADRIACSADRIAGAAEKAAVGFSSLGRSAAACAQIMREPWPYRLVPNLRCACCQLRQPVHMLLSR